MQTARSGRYAILGRPAFITDELLDAVAREARDLRSSAEATGPERGQAGQLTASPGPLARRLVVHRGWRALCRDAFGYEPQKPFHAAYLYYDTPGAGIVPHVDDPAFAVNLLFMVSRRCTGEQRSATVLHPAGSDVVRVVLEPGEALLLEADGLVHAREPMQAGEDVTLLSMGFQSPMTAYESPT